MTPRLRPHSGEAATVVVVVLAIAAIGAWLFKPKSLDGETRRAEAGKTATTALVTTIEAADAAHTAQSAAAAASVAKIGEVAASLPSSPAADFITREVPVALGYLPAPDPAALLAAERRRVAIMSGQLEEARRLYADAYRDAQAAAERATRAEAARDEAIAARQRADAAIAEAAAANLALARRSRLQWAALALVSTLALAAWCTGVRPSTIGAALAAVRAGESPIAAFDRVLPAWMHTRVNRAARLATALSEDSAR